MISTITSSGLLAALAILSDSNLIVSTTATTYNNEETDDIKNNTIQRHRQSRRVIPPPYYSKTTTEDYFVEEEEEGETLVNVFKVDINRDELPGGGGIFNDNEEEEKNEIVPYIVGGSDIVTPRKYPYFVSLGGCGGSLIRPNIVLSAAHCEGLNPDTVTLGLHKIQLTNSDTDEFYNIEHINVAESVIHPNYNGNTLDNDYWLLRLEKESRYDPVELDTPNDSLNMQGGEELVVFGFGTTEQGGEQPNVIQEVTVDYKPNDSCGSYPPGDLTDNMLCAGRQGKDSCQGDSGGPIIHKITGKQVGIVSWGYGCANPRFPGIYSRVPSQYDDFIKPYIDKWTDPTYLADNANPVNPIYNTCADSFNGGFYNRDGVYYNCLWYGTSDRYCDKYGDIGHGGSSANEACCVCGGGVATSGGEIPTPAPTPSPTPRPTRDRTNNCPQNRGLGSSLSTATKDRAFGDGGGGRPGKCRPNVFGGERALRRCRCRNGLDP